jgi:RNA polymerase sigma factor (TIGR02999 family)
MGASSIEITGLLRAWSSGDPAALGRLAERVYPELCLMAAQMMRHILVDAARTRNARKRGGNAVKVDLDEIALISSAPDRSILALDEALTAFSQVAPRQAKVVELRYFGGLTEEEIVAVLKISPRTVRRDWVLAKAWLLRELNQRRARHDARAFPAN